MDDNAPLSPGGWQIWKHTYDGRPAKLMYSAMSLDWCQKYLTNWKVNADGTAEVYISPVDGWESIKADPFGSIAWAIANELVSIQRGAVLIREIADEVADRLPDEGTLGLAIYYLRATIEKSGGDDEIELVVEKLSKNLHRRIGDIDAPIPF